MRSIKLFNVTTAHRLNQFNTKINEIVNALPPVDRSIDDTVLTMQIRQFILEKLKSKLESSKALIVTGDVDPETFSAVPYTVAETEDTEAHLLYLGITAKPTPVASAAAAASGDTPSDADANICLDNSYEFLKTGSMGRQKFKVKLSFLNEILDEYQYQEEMSRYGVAWSRYKQQLINYAKTIPGANITTGPDSLRSAIVSGLYARYRHFEEMGLGTIWNDSFFSTPFHFAAENNIDRTLYILANYNNPWKFFGHSHTETVRTLIRSLSPQLNARKAALKGKTSDEQRKILNEADRIIFDALSPLYDQLCARGETGSLMAKLQYLLLPYFIKHIETHDPKLYINLQVPFDGRAPILPLKFLVHADPSVPADGGTTAAPAAAAASSGGGGAAAGVGFGSDSRESAWALLS